MEGGLYVAADFKFSSTQEPLLPRAREVKKTVFCQFCVLTNLLVLWDTLKGVFIYIVLPILMKHVLLSFTG